MSHVAKTQHNPEVPELTLRPEVAFTPDNEIEILKDFLRNPEVTEAQYEAMAPPVIGYLSDEEKQVFARGRELHPVERAEYPETVQFYNRQKPEAVEYDPARSFKKHFPKAWETIQKDLQSIGMKPSSYWATYSRRNLKDGEQQFTNMLHTDGFEGAYALGSGDESGDKVCRLALYVVTSDPTTEFYEGPASISRKRVSSLFSAPANFRSLDIHAIGDYERDPETYITSGDPFAIRRMTNLTLHRSPKIKLDKAVDASEKPEITRSFMRLWCEEWVSVDEFTKTNDPNELLTLDELYKRMPELNMTQELGLVAIKPDGTERPAKVGYSSDLHSFAIMEQGKVGTAGLDGIVAWHPLPTRTTRDHGRFGPQTTVKNKDQLGKDKRPRAEQTLFRVATRS